MSTENCTLPTDRPAIAGRDKQMIRKIVAKDYEDKRNKRFTEASSPLILHVKLEELIKYSHIALQQFPKKEKYQLCADIKNSLYEALHLTIRMEKRYHKKTTLQDIDTEIDFLRTLIRLSYNLKYITIGHLEAWMSQADEAGKIVGGLMKYFNSK